MANVKGTDLLTIRRLLAEGPPGAEGRALARVSTEAVEAYRRTVASTWTPVELQAALFDAAARELFPNRTDAVELLFVDVARRSYSTVYRIFLKVPSVQFLVSQAANLWKTYYDEGYASAEDAGRGRAYFHVSEFPGLPKALRSAIAGHIRFLVENTGAKHVTITVTESHPVRWTWYITYR
jgi:hypothetical protein